MSIERKIEQMFDNNGIGSLLDESKTLQFAKLLDIIKETNKVMNITAIEDDDGIISKHFIDCAIPSKTIAQNSNVLDIGCGGGMPTLPFAILRPDINITGLDATEKKTRFVLDTAKKLGLENVHVLSGRAEEFGKEELYREKFDFVTARAVSRLNVLLELASPFCKVGGKILTFKGKNGQEELDEVENAIFKLCLHLDGSNYYMIKENDSVFERNNYEFSKITKLDNKYPRQYSQIVKKPL